MALVPAFLGLRRPALARPARPFRAPHDPDLIPPDVRPPPRAAPEAAPDDDRVETFGEDEAGPEAFQPPPAPHRLDAHDLLVAEQVAKPRRWSGLGRHPELIAAHRKVSDHLGLWEVCRARVCRRARACVGPEAVACLYDHRELVRPILPELGRLTRRICPED